MTMYHRSDPGLDDGQDLGHFLYVNWVFGIIVVRMQ